MRKLLLVGAAVVAAGIFLKRDKVAGLLPSKTEPYSPPSPGPSNYDAPGPVANTATPVPAPEAQQPAAVDEAAEEAAAAAEAANIGGTVSDYAGADGKTATEAERPLAESGEGVAEGQEQAELDLETAAEEPTGWAPPTTPADAPAPFEEATEAEAATSADQPTVEAPAVDEPAESPTPESGEASGDDEDDGGSDWRTWSGRSINP